MPGQEQEDIASTEQKIKEAARRVFTRKGYAATRTRDIAEESGYNLALINYYFRSKERLFDIIMVEQLQAFVSSIAPVLNDRQTSLQEKIGLLAGHYIDMLTANPSLPVFMLSEIHANPEKLLEKIGVAGKRPDFYIGEQWRDMVANGLAPAINPIHILINAVAMTVFPFAAKPLLKNRMQLEDVHFQALMEERKRLIPKWVASMLQVR